MRKANIMHGRITLPAVFLGVTIFLCSLAEFFLLEIKFNLFSGGFLQSHQLATTGQRLSFILSFLVFNVILYGNAYFLFCFLLRKMKVKDTIAAFHFMIIAAIATAISLVTQFQLHKYFADAMDMALIQNITGGDVKTALIYVMDEAFLFIIGLAFLFVLYFLIYKMTKKILVKYDEGEVDFSRKQRKRGILGYYLVGSVLVAALILLINQNENLRYNLNRSNSFSVVVSVFNYLSDVDRDGYGSFHFPQDVAIFNSVIYPGALDIPNNGIDEDGFFGDFVNYIPSQDMALASAPVKSPKHIVTIIMESARADIIGKRINEKLVAPNITTLSKEGQFIEEAYSHTGYTASSLATFFSGNIGNFTKDKSIYPILKKYGYQIALFSGQDETWGNLDIKLGTRKYADFFYDAQAGVEKREFPSKLPSSIKLSEKTLWQEFKKYSDNLDWNRPQFIYFNMQAAHFPYYHGNMTKTFVEKGIPRSKINYENREWLQNTYWNAINYADFYVGKIISELKEKGIWQDTLLIISGDHGEELFDNNHLGHGFFISEVQTHIPFVMNRDDFKVTQPVGHKDMKNIILSVALNGTNVMASTEADKEKSVFQLIGGLNNPAKIALRYSGKMQITLDLRNMLVRPMGKENWISYDAAMNKPDVKAEVKKLILHWENLRWRSHMEEKSKK